MEQKHPMLGPAKILTGLHQCRRQCAGLEIHLRAQQRKREPGHLNPAHVVAS
jgi:hypothetical protein